jgi:quercetin dioxygenase-like cupin family protein
MNVNIIRPVNWMGGAIFRTVACDTDSFRMENTAAPGQRAPAHVHDHMSETFLIREGEATFWIGPERSETHARAGDRVVAPAGVEHAFTITSNRPAVFEVEFRPACDMAHMMAIIAGLQDDGESAWMAKFIYLEQRQHLQMFSRPTGVLGLITNLTMPLLMVYGDLAGWKRLVGRYTPSVEASVEAAVVSR